MDLGLDLTTLAPLVPGPLDPDQDVSALPGSEGSRLGLELHRWLFWASRLQMADVGLLRSYHYATWAHPS